MDLVQSFYDKHSRSWSGPKKQPLYDFDCSLGKIMFTVMKNYPKSVVQICDTDGRSVTNEEALTWAVRIAQRFKKMGLRHDDVIGIAARNSTYLMPVGVACLMNCTPFHAVNPILDEKSMKHLFTLTKPKLIFCDGEVYEKVRSATRDLKPLIYTLTDHIEDVAKVDDLLETTHTEMYYRPEPLALGGEQTVAILCSSGTTGLPKAVCISSFQLSMNYLLLTSQDIIYTSSSLDWITGVYFLIASTTLSCTRVITNRPYSPEYFVELVKKYKISYAAVAPRHVATLITCPAATTQNMCSIRGLLLGGGCISEPSLQRIQSILKGAFITYGYGLTETGGISGNMGIEYGNSVGKLVPGMRVRIVDDNGKNLGPNEVGEIYAHNGYFWNGYYGNPIETQRMQDSLGWFHTGDVGYFNDKNFLFVVDRKKDTLKYQGMHYWPAEIEDAISELPDVVDVCVVSVYDECNGDAAGALVVKKKNSALTERAIAEQVAKRLPVVYKQLHAGVRFVEKLPQNDNGKTVKKEAKALFEQTKA